MTATLADDITYRFVASGVVLYSKAEVDDDQQSGLLQRLGRR